MSTSDPSASAGSAEDGLIQPQREAIVDLLLYAMYEDRRVGMQEDVFIDQHVRQMRWESGTYAQTYVGMATARVREARETAEGRERFLQEINTRLNSAPARQRALDMCRAMLNEDKAESVEESNFLTTLRNTFGL